MGDPEVPIWTDIPSSFELPEVTIVESGRELVINISDVAVETSGIILTLQGQNYYHREITDEATEYRFLLPDLVEAKNITITVSRNGYIPFQIVVEVPSGTRGLWYIPIAAVAIAAVVILFTAKRLKFS